MGVSGEKLAGVFSARDFVGWYNGLPSKKEVICHFHFNSSHLITAAVTDLVLRKPLHVGPFRNLFNLFYKFSFNLSALLGVVASSLAASQLRGHGSILSLSYSECSYVLRVHLVSSQVLCMLSSSL